MPLLASVEAACNKVVAVRVNGLLAQQAWWELHPNSQDGYSQMPTEQQLEIGIGDASLGWAVEPSRTLGILLHGKPCLVTHRCQPGKSIGQLFVDMLRPPLLCGMGFIGRLQVHVGYGQPTLHRIKVRPQWNG